MCRKRECRVAANPARLYYDRNAVPGPAGRSRRTVRWQRPNRAPPGCRHPPPKQTWRSLFANFFSLNLKESDWNGLGSDPPTLDAIGRAISVLWALKSTWIQPDRVAASAEGGVAITFRRDRKFASIESLNSGEIVVLTSDGTGNPRAREIEASDDALRQTAQNLREYFEL